MRVSCFAGFVVLVARLAVVAKKANQVSPRAYVEEALNYLHGKVCINIQSTGKQCANKRSPEPKMRKLPWDTYPAIAYAIT